MASEMKGYHLSRAWFDWSFENTDLISPNHTALYFFIIEQCNRMGWKEKFGLPTSMAKDAIGIKSYNTYIKTLNDLVQWGFVKMVERSKNQYSANIVALLKFDNALDKAVDKALDTAILNTADCPIKISQSTCESTVQSTCESICSIDKPQTTSSNSSQEGISEDQKFVDEIIDQDPEVTGTPNLQTQTEIQQPLEPEPVGSEAVKKAAAETWMDTVWCEAVCMGNYFSMEDLSRWLALYNASLSNDVIKDFSTRSYKKMFQGWLSTQKAKGYKLPPKDQSQAFTERTKTYAVR